MTKKGQIIYNIIEEVTCHPTAEEIYRIACDRGVSISLATVYNNLAALTEEGLIRKLSNPGQPDRYDKLLRHDHLICSVCGKISDVFSRDLTDILEAEAGVKLASYDLRLIYTCEECR